MIGGAPSALSVRNCSAGARIGESCVDRKAKNLWTADGVYSTRSAYLIQFRGSHRKFKHELIWKAQAENKCKLHAWILMHNKVLTVDNLQKRGWPHQEHCVLCNGPLEIGLHLSLFCPFAQAIWGHVLSWENLMV